MNQIEQPSKTKSKLKGLGAIFKALNPLWFLLPALLILVFWIYYPFIKTIYYSFTQWNLMPDTSPVAVGINNYKLLLSLSDFRKALLNTLWYIIGMVPFSVIIPLILAIVTENLSNRAKNIYRALFFIPMIMPPVTVSTIWQWLFHPTNGLINHVLINLGIIDTGINFLNDEKTALLSIIVIAGWKMIGFSTLMFSAALTGIDKSYYEAAELDGSSKLRQTVTITLPLISPTVLFMMMLSILFTAQWTFAYINVLTQGGPGGATTNIYYLIYTYGMKSFNVGMSSAAAITFFILFGIISLIVTRINNRLEFYDN
jgi:multiple sugar transport system permease protein